MGLVGTYLRTITGGSTGPMFIADRWSVVPPGIAPDFTVCNSTVPNNWFILKDVGYITLVVTTTWSTAKYIPNLFFNGRSIQAIHWA